MVPVTIKVETRLGAEEAGKLQYAVKLLDLSRSPKLPVLMPNFIPKLFNQGSRAIDEVLIDRFGSSFEVEVLEGFDESFDTLFESVASVMPCLPEKNAAFLRWRYGPGSPQAPVTILGIRGEESLLGYAVLWVTSRDPKEGYLLDLTTLPGRHDVARALAQEAVRHFTRAGVYIVRYWFIESYTSPLSKDLWRLGFFLRRNMPAVLLVKFAGPDLHKIASNPARWSYSLGDGEASFWIR
jgi:hypothetical protein